MIDKYFDKIVCIALDKRIANNELVIVDQLSKYTKNVELFICGNGELLPKYDYIDSYPLEARNPQYYNYSRCVKEVVKRADISGTNKLLLLEDDADLTLDFEERFPAIMEEVSNIKYDALFLGGVHWNGVCYNIDGKNHIILPTFSADMHAIVLNNSIFGDVLKIKDCYKQPFDLYFSELQKTKIIPAANPSVIVQKRGYSYNSKDEIKWTGRYADISYFYPDRKTVKLC